MTTAMQKAKGFLASYLMDGAAGGDNKAAADLVDRLCAKLHDFIKAADDGMAATATAETDIGTPDGPGKPIKAWLEPTNGTGLVAVDADFATIIVRARDAAHANPKIIAQVTTKTVAAGGSGNWAQGVRVPIPLNNVDLSMVDGSGLTVEITKGGMGVVVPAFILFVEVSPE